MIKGKKKTICCYEWDQQHGNFEIYDAKGNHQGSMFCDQPETFDYVCPNKSTVLGMIKAFGWGDHNKADTSGKHSPRDGCKK